MANLYISDVNEDFFKFDKESKHYENPELLIFKDNKLIIPEYKIFKLALKYKCIKGLDDDYFDNIIGVIYLLNIFNSDELFKLVSEKIYIYYYDNEYIKFTIQDDSTLNIDSFWYNNITSIISAITKLELIKYDNFYYKVIIYRLFINICDKYPEKINEFDGIIDYKDLLTLIIAHEDIQSLQILYNSGFDMNNYNKDQLEDYEYFSEHNKDQSKYIGDSYFWYYKNNLGYIVSDDYLLKSITPSMVLLDKFIKINHHLLSDLYNFDYKVNFDEIHKYSNLLIIKTVIISKCESIKDLENKLNTCKDNNYEIIFDKSIKYYMIENMYYFYIDNYKSDIIQLINYDNERYLKFTNEENIFKYIKYKFEIIKLNNYIWPPIIYPVISKNNELTSIGYEIFEYFKENDIRFSRSDPKVDIIRKKYPHLF